MEKNNRHTERTAPRATIYVSGAITGRPAAEYKAQFSTTASRLQGLGYEVINPLNNGLPEDADWHAHMKADIRLLTYCDEIYMMAGWERSTGATAEHALATALGMAIHYEKPPRHSHIKHAILTALGVTFRDICRRGRKRSVVYARFIYCHHAAMAGDTATTISQELGHKHSNVSYYLRQYAPEYEYNREFRNAARAVADLIKLNNPEA